jgi:quinol-cytochrome oxidoreductase complex cytochrome b subunit
LQLKLTCNVEKNWKHADIAVHGVVMFIWVGFAYIRLVTDRLLLTLLGTKCKVPESVNSKTHVAPDWYFSPTKKLESLSHKISELKILNKNARFWNHSYVVVVILQILPVHFQFVHVLQQTLIQKRELKLRLVKTIKYVNWLLEWNCFLCSISFFQSCDCQILCLIIS